MIPIFVSVTGFIECFTFVASQIVNYWGKGAGSGMGGRDGGRGRCLELILVTATTGNNCSRDSNLPLSGLDILIKLLYPQEASRFVYPCLVKFMFRETTEETADSKKLEKV